MKVMDPEKGPLVRLAFTYATGDYTFRKLNALLFDLRLRNRFGGRLTLSGLSHLAAAATAPVQVQPDAAMQDL